METYYWYDECTKCHQGRLIITKDVTNDRLYLHCEECEYGWLAPSEVKEPSKSFLTLIEDFETENPDMDTIKAYSWENYACHEFSE
ncbi:hypothetical protein [Vibrio rotiferianus]|uniref:hypothetical protein n=1 Tax=Vibrio rotiferianus TaxID=190895 RepID=UPI00039B95F4|nr:hypothetical protein [Vibrio rotiferianus]PIB11564.1 hypothetical protein B853_23930 [Vibrio rotiferianus CAIM 577 = LMG 21460]